MDSMNRPFIYIAALRRTGSTLLCRLLNQPTQCYIFREPQISRGSFRPRSCDIDTFAQFGVDLKRYAGYFGARTFLRRGLPECLRVFRQIGVKEIQHRWWKTVVRCLPDARFVITARDPRDIYASVVAQHLRDGKKCPTPRRIAQNIRKQFRFQLQMQQYASLLVRYEDLCSSGDERLPQICRFVGLPIAAPGPATSGPDERETILANSIERWKRIEDAELIKQTNAVFAETTEYCQYWGYTRDGVAALPSALLPLAKAA
jgi:hypothetical protein